MTPVLKEAKRLYDLGYGVLWIKPKSKAPTDSGWTKGPRKEWAELHKSYRPGMNVGVRLGAPSKIGSKFLSVIDIDVKSTDPKHRVEVERAVSDMFPSLGADTYRVLSGRGHGSSHIHILTDKPATPSKRKVSTDKVRVMMPSAAINKAQQSQLSPEDLDEGWRIRPAWEIAVMGSGQQVLLPPSIHPDSGKEYRWANKVETASGFKTLDLGSSTSETSRTTTEDWVPEDVEVFSSRLSSETIDIICDAEVEDRSAALFKVAIEMVKLGWTDRQIMSVLTDRAYRLGDTAFDHAKTTSRARAANWIFNYTLKKARSENDAALQFEAEVEEIPLTEDAAQAQAAELLAKDWRDQLERNLNKGAGFGRVKTTLRNMILILANEVSEGVFRRDLFAHRDSYGCDTPWGGRAGSILNDDDIVLIREWFSNRYRIEVKRELVVNAVIAIALKSAFHPVRDYLASLEWDGISRVDTWLADFLHAKGPQPYLGEVSRKILVAMIARVMAPGIKFDHIPVLEGIQGIGKSSAARILASEAWFADNLPGDLRHADARLTLQGKWIIEMGELASLKKADLEQIKAYVTSSTDRVRAPYGYFHMDIKRQSVFIGTTNESSYLKDKSGNRRFWPIEVGQCDFKGLTKARDQLFAEALLVWENFGEPLYLEGPAKLQAEETQGEKVIEDEETMMEIQFDEFLEREKLKNGESRWDFRKWFSMLDLFRMAGPWVDGARPQYPYLQMAARVLTRRGFEKKTVKGSPRWRVISAH